MGISVCFMEVGNVNLQFTRGELRLEFVWDLLFHNYVKEDHSRPDGLVSHLFSE